MSKRQRPGKRERETSVKAAIRKVRNVKMDETRKVIGLLREEQRLARGYGKSSANRDKLKGGTGSVGFYGGRGFYSERVAMPGNGTVGRMTPDEATGRKVEPIVRGHIAPKSRPFAVDGYDAPPSRYVMVKRGKGQFRQAGTVSLGTAFDTGRDRAMKVKEGIKVARKRRVDPSVVGE